jgi:hypothetical protein
LSTAIDNLLLSDLGLSILLSNMIVISLTIWPIGSKSASLAVGSKLTRFLFFKPYSDRWSHGGGSYHVPFYAIVCFILIVHVGQLLN